MVVWRNELDHFLRCIYQTKTGNVFVEKPNAHEKDLKFTRVRAIETEAIQKQAGVFVICPVDILNLNPLKGTENAMRALSTQKCAKGTRKCDK